LDVGWAGPKTNSPAAWVSAWRTAAVAGSVRRRHCRIPPASSTDWTSSSSIFITIEDAGGWAVQSVEVWVWLQQTHPYVLQSFIVDPAPPAAAIGTQQYIGNGSRRLLLFLFYFIHSSLIYILFDGRIILYGVAVSTIFSFSFSQKRKGVAIFQVPEI